MSMQSLQEPDGAAQPSASKSSSFAFSRAGLAVTPGAQSCPEEAEAARRASVHPLGFFAAEGARQLCHVEGECSGLPSAEPVVAAVMLQMYAVQILIAQHACPVETACKQYGAGYCCVSSTVFSKG